MLNSPERSENPPSRPFGLWILTIGLLASPMIHAGALLLRTRWLNFGSLRVWDAFVYFLIAPIVGGLMLRRHERARFSAYVFLSCEILRAVRIHSPGLGLIDALAPPQLCGERVGARAHGGKWGRSRLAAILLVAVAAEDHREDHVLDPVRGSVG